MIFSKLFKWLKGEPISAETKRALPHKTSVVPPPAPPKVVRFEVDLETEDLPEEEGTEDLCFSANCNQPSHGCFKRYGRLLWLCEYHFENSKRIDFPKSEGDNGRS